MEGICFLRANAFFIFCVLKIHQFGNTGLEVSEVGVGMAALGRPGYINLGHAEDLEYDYSIEAMKSQAFHVLDTAYKLGVRYFDVARSYGKGEAFLGAWLKANNHKYVVAGSKWGYIYTADWQVNAKQHEVKKHTLEVLSQQWPESKQYLGKTLKIYHIHSAKLDSGVLENNEVLDYLWRLREEGVVIGLSLSGTAQADTLEKAMEITSGEKRLFQSVQVTWNILEQSTTQVLKKAAKNGMGIIVKEVFANGRLTNRNNDPAFAEKLKTLKKIADHHKVGVDAIAMAYVLHQPWISTALSGAATTAQLKSNIRACDVSLNDEELAQLKAMKEDTDDYWAKRSALSWN